MHRTIGCAMTAHRKSGRGFPEVVYQRALAVELFEQGLKAEREVELPIPYDDEKVGSHKADFFVDERILVGMKAVATAIVVTLSEVGIENVPPDLAFAVQLVLMIVAA